MKNTRKLLSIILAILMIATTVPFAFAADEIPDFSDAKVLTAVSGKLYIDGEVAEYLPAGKYKLTGDISTTVYLSVNGEVVLDLNGYTWDLNTCYISVKAPLSVYDTSTDKTGKITSSNFDTIWLNDTDAVFSLYGGTIENTSNGTGCRSIDATWASANLYGGKIVSNGYAVYCCNSHEIDETLKLGDVVLESGEGYAQINLRLPNYSDAKEMIIDVTDYTGDALEIDSTIDCLGKVEILKGIKSAEDAEKYKINVEPGYSYLFHEKTGYDEENDTKYVCMARNALTQQPTIDNNYTVDFSNPAATFQWYEVEEENIDSYDVDFSSRYLFVYDFKKGDILKVSTDSDLKFVHLMVGDYSLMLGNEKTATVKFDTDGIMTIESMMVDAENPVELEFSVVRETALDGETGETLQNPECGKLYWCKATVGTAVYTSDVVKVEHDIVVDEAVAPDCVNTGLTEGSHCTRCDDMTVKQGVVPALNHKDTLVQVDAKAKTCTEIGWDAYIYCTACDYTTFNEIPASHEIVNVEAKANTCTEIGWDAYEYCTECNYSTYEEKAALDHDIVVDAYVAPKCTETGLTEGQHCSRCDDMTVVQEVIPDLGGHINEDGNTTCDRCGETLICEYCGRPVHEGQINEYICMLIRLIKFVIALIKFLGATA
ncbi:MAG: hypothetical protein IJB74_05395 [Clostridia bacterium]|nr:hypothetical protein [Clostridia bacterium]